MPWKSFTSSTVEALLGAFSDGSCVRARLEKYLQEFAFGPILQKAFVTDLEHTYQDLPLRRDCDSYMLDASLLVEVFSDPSLTDPS